MKRIEVDVYSEAVNQAVLRMPGRRFPGSLIQGDSLKYLVTLAEDIAEQLPQLTSDEELIGTAAELLKLLRERLLHWEEVLQQH